MPSITEIDSAMQLRQTGHSLQARYWSWVSSDTANKAAYIGPGSPWENGYYESFNVRFCERLLNGEVFYSPREDQILIEQWRVHTAPSGHIARCDIGHLRQKASFRRTIGQRCTKNQTGPSDGGPANESKLTIGCVL